MNQISNIHHTLTTHAPGFPRPEPSTFDALPALQQWMFDAFEDRFDNERTVTDGVTARAASARDDHDRAKGALQNLGPDADDRAKQAAQEKVARTRKRMDEQDAEAMRSLARPEGICTVAGNCARLVEGARTYEPTSALSGVLHSITERGRLAGFSLRIVEPKVPKGASLSAVSAEIAALRKERKGNVKAPASRDSVERALLDNLDRAARRGGIEIDVGSDGFIDLDDDGFSGVTTRAPSIRWPLNSSARLDVEALVARHLGEAIREEIRAELDQRYEGVTLTLDAHEKAKKLKEIDARLLELERVECALIWQQIKAGDTSVFFRPDANPRAVLGVA